MKQLLVGKSQEGLQHLDLKLANRHGLITGATGTGKTVTLQVLAEQFSMAGVPVFATDMKGDLSGIAAAGQPKPFLLDRAKEIGVLYEPKQFPVMLWDVFGVEGRRVRTTVEDVGPLLFSRLLGLTPTQDSILQIAFKMARDEDLRLNDLKDMRAVLHRVAGDLDHVGERYGYVSQSTVSIAQRQVLVLEENGGAEFFGQEPFDVRTFIRHAPDGRGMINLMSAEQLSHHPQLYATFLVWLLAKLFRKLPERGDADKPELVLLLDEAHIMFTDAPKVLLRTIEKVVRLIRSKGVGVYLVTQNPLDVPDTVSAQLGNRVQHALRAFTPREQKAVKTAADTFRANPRLDTQRVIMELGKGEALVSFLEGNGTPAIVQRTLIAPPQSMIGPLDRLSRARVIALAGLGYDAPPETTLEAPLMPTGLPAGSRAMALALPIYRYDRQLNHTTVMTGALLFGMLLGWVMRGLIP